MPLARQAYNNTKMNESQCYGTSLKKRKKAGKKVLVLQRAKPPPITSARLAPHSHPTSQPSPKGGRNAIPLVRLPFLLFSERASLVCTDKGASLAYSLCVQEHHYVCPNPSCGWALFYPSPFASPPILKIVATYLRSEFLWSHGRNYTSVFCTSIILSEL